MAGVGADRPVLVLVLVPTLPAAWDYVAAPAGVK
jgi:hypothetical protein